MPIDVGVATPIAHFLGTGRASWLDRSNGFEVAVPYYLRLAADRDITITPHLYTGAAPMLEGEFRALTDIGSFRING